MPKQECEKDKKINLDLNSPVLRGIRIPEAGFYKYDELKGITTSDEEIFVVYI